LGLYQLFDRHSLDWQFAEHLPLLGAWQYHAGVNGVGVLFILLTALICLLVILYIEVVAMAERTRLFRMVLLIQASLMSQFVSLDVLWFALVSAIQIIACGYMMWYWATSPERNQALARYAQFMIIGWLLFFSGVLMLGWYHASYTGYWSFDIRDLAQLPLPPAMASVIFFLLFYGLAVRIPMFPLHGWLPQAAHHGMPAIAPALFLGLKAGVFGLIQFVLPLLPGAVLQWHKFIAGFALAGVFYAALLAMQQENLRRMMAFAVISHTGILTLGLFSLNQNAFQSGVLMAMNFGLAITCLLFMAGIIYWRNHTLLLRKLGGLFETLPLIGGAFFVAGLAIIGMPGTPGFDAVHLMLEASINRFGALLTVAAAVGNVLTAGFLLWAFQRAFLGPRATGQSNSSPASTQEKIIAVLVILILLGVGFFPEPWLELIDAPLNHLTQLYDAGTHHD
ncbi:MAG TPA: NADH-quinone oxidoreductase subunit M, partial [Gammaproteobacteria bacterium]|nr:NADH-quinone oxidoreductase subunit M [Gammaproteobacteria bacterium]